MQETSENYATTQKFTLSAMVQIYKNCMQHLAAGLSFTEIGIKSQQMLLLWTACPLP